MFALAFDLELRLVRANRTGHVSGAYNEIRDLLVNTHGFQWTQGSLYVLHSDDMSSLFGAIQALMGLAWFRNSVRDLRGFRVEQWSNFTSMVTAGRTSGTAPPAPPPSPPPAGGSPGGGFSGSIS